MAHDSLAHDLFAATIPEIEPTSSGPADTSQEPAIVERDVSIPQWPGLSLAGTLSWRGQPRGIVVFAHGSGSSRHSPRNRFVASVLHEAGFATLLFDLLSEWEAVDRRKVFDVEFLADRLIRAADWVRQQPEWGCLPLGLFGASTGSAAALLAASSHPGLVGAIVSRGGRPDLAWNDLPLVRAPTLLIVGSEDTPVVEWNQQAYQQLTCPKELVVIPGAGHLFEEPGALEQVADHARRWFERYLTQPAPPNPEPHPPQTKNWL